MGCLRETEYRLAKRGDAYLMQWRFVNSEIIRVSKWWQLYRADYECVNSYGDWQDTPAVVLDPRKGEEE